MKAEPGNADLVRAAFAQWNTGAREALLEQIDHDIVIDVQSSQIFGGAPYRGHEGYRQWVAAMEESFEVWQIQPETFEERGESVVVLGRMHLRGRGSGVALDQETGWIVDFRDGKMCRFRSFLSHSEALRASGIS